MILTVCANITFCVFGQLILIQLGIAFISIFCPSGTLLLTNGESSSARPANSDQLFVAGVRDAGQDVAAAVGHGGTSVFGTVRWTPLAHFWVDGCRPLFPTLGV